MTSAQTIDDVLMRADTLALSYCASLWGAHPDSQAMFVPTGEAGILTETVNLLPCDALTKRVAQMLDCNMYGYPTNDDLDFQTGLYDMAPATNEAGHPYDMEILRDIVSSAKPEEAVKRTIERGCDKRRRHEAVVDARYAASKIMSIVVKGEKEALRVRVSVGDAPLVDSVRRLAIDTGIGILVYYDLATNRTHFTMCCTAESERSALALLEKLVPGSIGAKFIATGSVVGMHTIDHYFSAL